MDSGVWDYQGQEGKAKANQFKLEYGSIKKQKFQLNKESKSSSAL
jgi:hypothetical protein